MKIWITALTILVLFLSIFVGNLYCQGVPYDNNAAGFIVASLAVLVTVLLGWQIFNSMSFERRFRKIEVKTNTFQESLLFQKNYADAATTYLHAKMLFQNAREVNSKKLYMQAYIKYYTALDLFLKSSYEIAEDCIKSMETCHKVLFTKTGAASEINEEFNNKCEICFDNTSANFSKLSKELRDKLINLRDRRRHTERYIKDEFDED